MPDNKIVKSSYEHQFQPINSYSVASRALVPPCNISNNLYELLEIYVVSYLEFILAKSYHSVKVSPSFKVVDYNIPKLERTTE